MGGNIGGGGGGLAGCFAVVAGGGGQGIGSFSVPVWWWVFMNSLSGGYVPFLVPVLFLSLNCFLIGLLLAV